ncbi:MAG: sulfite exporter TauE/SafE family protein [Pseudomonadota bacterium]
MPPLILTLEQPLILLGVAVLAVFAGFIRGFTGFGGPALMIVALTLFFAPGSVAGKVLIMDLLANVNLARAAMREANLRDVCILSVSTLVGVPLGLIALLNLDDRVMQDVLGVTTLIAATVLTFGWRLRKPPNVPLLIVAGFVGGVIATATGVALLMVAFFFSGPAATALSRANAILWLFLITGVVIGSYVYGGLLTLDDIWRSGLIGLFYLSGSFLGARVFVASAEATVRKAAIWLLFALALIGVVS